MHLSRFVNLRGVLLVAVLALLGAPAALADSSTSSNWSGYVAHGDGARFTSVSALWTQPSATCTPGSPTYSAVWVGIGGYSLSSPALEQIGTEADCTASGHVVSSAWYELVPSPSTDVPLIVRPGDVMSGKVTVVGHLVTVTLTDRTRHKSFTKKVMDPTLDVTSADWIVEAPSECSGGGAGSCQALPLANYGSETFAHARAETVKKQTSSISSRHWLTTAITLSASGRQYIGYSDTGPGESSPSPLLDSGTSFKVTYVPSTQQTPPPQQTAPTPAALRISASARASSALRLQPGGVRR